MGGGGGGGGLPWNPDRDAEVYYCAIIVAAIVGMSNCLLEWTFGLPPSLPPPSSLHLSHSLSCIHLLFVTGALCMNEASVMGVANFFAQ